MGKPDIDDEKYQHTEHVANTNSAVDEAREGTEAEHRLTFRDGVRLYPKAMAWSALVSTAIVMEGYDTALLGNFFAYPAWLDKFGTMNAAGEMAISANWMTALGNGGAGGQCLGLFINGLAVERFGYRKTLIASLIFMIGALFFPFFSPNLHVLLAGQIIQGIPWGIFQTLTTAYASEICPVALRAYLTTYVNLCWVIGQLIAAGVLRGMLSRTDALGYKIPYAIQWIWPVPILIGAFFCPESPWWLVRHGRIEEARQVIVSVTSPKHTEFNPDAYVAMIVHTNALEQSMSSGTSYLDCFRGVDLRRTEITCVVWVIQAWCGSSLMGQSTYFLLQAGMARQNAFSLNIAQSALGFAGTVSSWFLMPHFGRRTLYLWGQVIMCLLLVVIGGMGFIPASSKIAASWGIGAMLLVFTFVYDITVGPVCYCLVAEMSATRLRAKTVVLSRIAYNIAGICTGFFQPYMLNPENLNWGAKIAWFWLGMGGILTAWTFFRLPEAKDRTYGEMDILFEQKISARKFSTTEADQFTHAGANQAMEQKSAAAHVEHV